MLQCILNFSTCQCLVKSGKSVEGNPVALPKRGEVNGIINDPLPVTVAEGDVRGGGDRGIERDGDDIIGSLPVEQKN